MCIHIHAYIHVPRLLLVTPGGCFKDPVLVHPFWRLAMLPSVPSTMAEVCGETSESLVLMLVRTEATWRGREGGREGGRERGEEEGRKEKE